MAKSIKKIFIIAGLSLLVFPIFVFAQNRAAIDVSIPCISCAHADDPSPVGLIANFYELAIAFSGVLALGIIIYAGIIRIINANNPGKVGETNDMIYNALLGIVLLFGAYILLNTINPQLTKLELPALSEIEAPPKTDGDLNPDTYIYCGNKKTDGTISTKCPLSDDKCVDRGELVSPRYSCVKQDIKREYYACVKTGVVICNGSPVAYPESLAECQKRCLSASGTTCEIQTEICNPPK